MGRSAVVEVLKLIFTLKSETSSQGKKSELIRKIIISDP